MKAIKLLILILPLIIGVSSFSFGAVINVPVDQPTIASAVAAASSGDEIVLASGTYLESGIIISIDLTIRGNELSSTIIDANGYSGSIFRINGGTLNLSWLTLKGINGSGWYKTAIHNAAGDLNVDNCLITDNVGGYGSAIFQEAATSSMTVTNSTISGNTASIGTSGIYIYAGNMSLVNTTITNNTTSAGSSCGGVRAHGSGTLSSTNCIIYGNFGGASSDIILFAGAALSVGTDVNIFGNNISPVTGTYLMDDPVLSALADNGGASLTHAILYSSPAFNAGTLIGAPTIDQIGVARVGNPDLGAFEAAAPPIADQTTSASANTICENESVTIDVDDSEVGINYFLRDDSDSSIVDGPLAGTGNALTFSTGTLTSTTTFHVYAELNGIALDFDDVDDRVEVSPIPPMSGAFTVMGWINTTSGSIKQIIGWGAASGISLYTNFTVGFGKLRYYSKNTNPNTSSLTGNIIVNDGDWHHVAFTRDGGTNMVSLYVDGVLDVQAICPVMYSPFANTTLGGTYANGSYQGTFNGSMDDLSVWSSELTLLDIQDHMDNGTLGTEANLEAYYDFEENTGINVGDNSSNSFDGVMVNMDSSSDWVEGILKERQIMSTMQIITVNPLPNVAANSTATTVCDGEQITLTGAGASTYAWDNGATNNTAFAPTATTTYEVTGTDANNCINTDQVTITVNSLPTVAANSTATTVCDGEQITLTGAGASTYAWDNGATNNTAFAPTATTTYEVTGTDANNCTNTDQVTITVNSLPTVVANSTATAVCDGEQITLTGAGANTYAWDNGATNNTAFAPTVTTTYEVTGTDANNCTNTDQVTITFNSLPTVVANSTATTVCDGEQITLTGAGANTYAWDNGATNNTAFAPTSTTTYEVTGTDANNCINTDQVTITVNSLPTVVANSTATTVCDGEQITLTGAGATTYTWDNGATDNTAFTPTATTTYEVTGTDANNCTNTDQVTITVNSLPTVVANSTATTVCDGEQITLTGAGANTYAWDNGATDNTPFAPTATTTYEVTGTDANNCTNTDQVTITVNSLPTVVANSTATTVCEGEQITLTGAGADTYAWDNGATDNTAFVPTATTTYEVTGTDANNCTNTDQVTITVNTVDNTVNLAGLTLSAAASGASYQWLDCDNGNAIISGETNQSFTATINGSYAVEVTENGCADTSICTVIDNVGNHTIDFKKSLSVYPNPTDGQFNIILGETYSNIHLVVTDISGKIVLKDDFMETEKITINLTAPSGYYMVKLLVPSGESATLKLIKN